MFINEGIDEDLKYYFGGAYATLDTIEISDDGSFTIPDELVEKFRRFWFEYLGLSWRGNDEAQKLASYNMAMVACYQHLFNPTTLCYGVDVPITLLLAVRDVGTCMEKLTNPGNLWDYYLSFIRDYGDWIDSCDSKGCDTEAEISDRFATHMKKILEKEEE